MTNKEKATALWAVVMDRSRGNAEHRAALDELLLLKRAAKTTLDKLGVPQVMWDREDATNRRNAELAAGLEEDALAETGLMRSALSPKATPQVPAWDPSRNVGWREEELKARGDDFTMSDEELAKQKGRRDRAAEEALEANLSKTDAQLVDEAKPIRLEQGRTPDGGSVLKPSNPVVEKVAAGEDVTPTDLAAAQAVTDERGAISKTVRHMLLNTDHPYAHMVELIKAKHPTAKTTARSIASVASDLRRAKFAVRERRRDAL